MDRVIGFMAEAGRKTRRRTQRMKGNALQWILQKFSFDSTYDLPCQSSSSMALSQQKNKGFTLVETMISIFILTIGLLGLASMQISSMGYSQQSYYDTQMLYAVNGVIDSMRVYISKDPTSAKRFITHEAGTECVLTQASPENEVSCFRQKIAANLPFGNASISIDGEQYIISIFWADNQVQRLKVSQEETCTAPRVWSETLTWTHHFAPAKPLCMYVRSWPFQISKEILIVK